MADTSAYIVDAVRTPVGRRGGGLSAVHPADLSAHVLRALVQRTGIDPERVDDVILGCVGQMGAQTFNIARTAWLSAGLPESVPGVTIDRQCGSSQQSVHFAAQAIMSGNADLVVAGGVEVMSLVPIASTAYVGEREGMGSPMASQGWIERYGTTEFTQFRAAELIAQKWAISREAMEEFALQSHQRALKAQSEHAFDREIVVSYGVETDESPRNTSMERMAGLAPLIPGGRITAAVSSPISDGASALLIASASAVKAHGLTPLARIRAMAVVGSDPELMLTGPIAATESVLARAGLTMDDIDLFEINEAFASVVLAWQQDTKADLERTNVLGGAIALGHPLGASGGRIMATLVHLLTRTDARLALQTMCEGGGMANATIIEKV